MKTRIILFIIIIAINFACNNREKGNALMDNSSKQSVRMVSNNNLIKGFKTSIENQTLESDNYRKVLYTGEHMQLVLMSLNPGEEIGAETHANSDQFFRFESGHGKCIINEAEYEVKGGDAIVVPAGARHNVINTDPSNDLKLYTIYALPNHKDGIVRTTKKDADDHEAGFDGKTTEGSR